MTVLPSPAMPRGGSRENAGRDERPSITGEPPGTPKVNRAIPMTAGEWALVRALAEAEGKSAAAYVRDLLLDVATGKARIERGPWPDASGAPVGATQQKPPSAATPPKTDETG
jgi:hypothetical protein